MCSGYSKDELHELNLNEDYTENQLMIFLDRNKDVEIICDIDRFNQYGTRTLRVVERYEKFCHMTINSNWTLKKKRIYILT